MMNLGSSDDPGTWCSPPSWQPFWNGEGGDFSARLRELSLIYSPYPSTIWTTL